ncbi:MAG: hypothetical protein ACT4OM_01675 [Actinomycetota bacterium]
MSCGAGDHEPTPLLAPPDLGAGLTGSCAVQSGPIAEVRLGLDSTSPKCIEVRPTQRLRVVNGLPRDVTVLLGGKGLEVGGNGESTFPLRFEQFLQPGGFQATTDAFGLSAHDFELRFEG